MSSSTSTSMNLPIPTSLPPPAGLAPIEGLPIAAHAVLHRELFHIHSSLQLILTILRPWDTLAPPLADTITCPRLLAHLRGLDASIDQIKRATCTTLAYTDQLFSALGLLHLTHFDREHTRLIAELRGQTTFLDTPAPPASFSSFTPRLIFSPPSPPPAPSTPTLTSTTGPQPPALTTPPRLNSYPLALHPATTSTRMTCYRSRSPALPRYRSHTASTRRSIKRLSFPHSVWPPTHIYSCYMLISLFNILGSEHTVRFDSIRLDHPALLRAMSGATSPPCGLAPTPGISLVAQAVLHRELLHVHASLAHIHTILHQPLALRSTPLLDRVTHPHLRAQLEGLDSTLLLALRVNHTAIHYTHELLTALGLLHTPTFSTLLPTTGSYHFAHSYTCTHVHLQRWPFHHTTRPSQPLQHHGRSRTRLFAPPPAARTTDQAQSTPTNRSSRRADQPSNLEHTSPTRLEHSGNLVYLMGDIAEIRLSPGPQQHIWTTPFWLHIRPSGSHDLWMDIHEHGSHDWIDFLNTVDQYRDELINHPSRPCSWEECEAPEVLPRTLVDTTIQELIRLLPTALRRIPPTSWSEHFGNFMTHIAHAPRIIERNPIFLWGKLPCQSSLLLLLKLDYPKSEYFRWTPHQSVYTFVHNCPPVSLQGILTDGVIRPSSWKHARESNFFPSLGFYCRCCYPGHGQFEDNRINSDITGQVTAELQCSLHVACGFGGRSASRKCFVAGECFSRQATHYVVKTGGLPCDALASHFYDVIRNKSDRRYKCRSSVSQIQMLDCSSVRKSCPPMAFVALIFLYDLIIYIQLYYSP